MNRPNRYAPESSQHAQLLEWCRACTAACDRSRPLWELHIIVGLPGDSFALYSKLQAIIARRGAKVQPDTDVQSLDSCFENVQTLGADSVRSRVRRLAARRRFFDSWPAISSGIPGHSRSRPAHCSRRVLCRRMANMPAIAVAAMSRIMPHSLSDGTACGVTTGVSST